VIPPTTLRTARLVLRPFAPSDAADIQRLANDVDVARNTLTIPHPYPDGAAETWIATLQTRRAEGTGEVFAICGAQRGELLGAIGLQIERAQRRAELGYWIGRDARGQGIASEAARAVLEHAFTALDLERVFASHFPWNPASARVMEKAGMLREGILRGHALKNGERVDLHFWGLLREEHARSRQDAGRRAPERA
jgi:RimJ/RimL family protein N-acetyltransferase